MAKKKLRMVEKPQPNGKWGMIPAAFAFSTVVMILSLTRFIMLWTMRVDFRPEQADKNSVLSNRARCAYMKLINRTINAWSEDLITSAFYHHRIAAEISGRVFRPAQASKDSLFYAGHPRLFRLLLVDEVFYLTGDCPFHSIQTVISFENGRCINSNSFLQFYAAESLSSHHTNF